MIAPLARDKTGAKLNCNADTAAGEVAAALKAEKLVVVSDTHGIRRNAKDPATMIPQVTQAEIQAMIRDGIITSGMLPKVEACLRALDGSWPRRTSSMEISRIRCCWRSSATPGSGR